MRRGAGTDRWTRDTLDPVNGMSFLAASHTVACLQGDPLDRAAVEGATHQDNTSQLGLVARVRATTTFRLHLHRPRLFIPGTDPQGTGPLIRDVSGEVDLACQRRGGAC